MGQTENTGHCEGMMCKNGEPKVDEFVCVWSHHLYIRGKLSAFL
jgi:hypothetical protein